MCHDGHDCKNQIDFLLRLSLPIFSRSVRHLRVGFCCWSLLSSSLFINSLFVGGRGTSSRTRSLVAPSPLLPDLIKTIQGCSNRPKTANSERSVKGKRLCVESNQCCAQRFRVSKDVVRTKQCCAEAGVPKNVVHTWDTKRWRACCADRFRVPNNVVQRFGKG